MAKATLTEVYEIHQDRQFVFYKCKAVNSVGGKPFSLYYKMKNVETMWSPQVGDNVQYFGTDISKIVSRPIKAKKERTLSAYHEVYVEGGVPVRNPKINELVIGDIFRFKQGCGRLYMVLDCREASDLTSFVNLTTGKVYMEKGDKEIIRLNPGTVVNIKVGEA